MLNSSGVHSHLVTRTQSNSSYRDEEDENLADINKSIISSILEWCKDLGNVILPNVVTPIKTEMFKNHKKLRKIIIPESVISIERYFHWKFCFRRLQ